MFHASTEHIHFKPHPFRFVVAPIATIVGDRTSRLVPLYCAALTERTLWDPTAGSSTRSQVPVRATDRSIYGDANTCVTGSGGLT